MEYVAKHEVVELVLETDFSGLAYEPLRRFLQGWKSIGSLTISSTNEADSVCVSDELLRDAAALEIEEVSIRCERAAGITDEGILDFWLSGASRSLEVIRPAISQDFFRRLVEAYAPSDTHGEATLTIYSSPNDVLRQLNWDDYFDNRKVAGPSGTTYEFTTDGVILELKISLDEYCRLEEGRKYDVLRVTRRPLD
ncbi:hypothetical protein AAVH_20295 [Aphelenchoides avenae]|nr:hypothetical protein AAVH_20295 [Aphelenchus avenae]